MIISEKKYTEDEKDFHVAQGVWKNNHVIFKMIEDDIDHLITKRISKFLEGHPKINALCSKESNAVFIANYKG